MMDVTRGAHGEVVIHIDGDFDATAATRLSGWLVEVPQDDPLVIDFTRVRRCEPVGLAAVAGNLAAHDRLQVRGLTRYHERMLRYLGVTIDAPADADDERDAG